MLGKPGPDSLFSLPLAQAVDVQRIGGIFFFIGALGFTVKNIIRGNMDKRYSQPFALIGKIGRPIPINGKGGLQVPIRLYRRRYKPRSLSEGAERLIRPRTERVLSRFRYIDRGDVQGCNCETRIFQGLDNFPPSIPPLPTTTILQSLTLFRGHLPES